MIAKYNAISGNWENRLKDISQQILSVEAEEGKGKLPEGALFQSTESNNILRNLKRKEY
jgi:hypothetical protein